MKNSRTGNDTTLGNQSAHHGFATACCIAALSAGASAASAQADCSFFDGQTIELVVPFNPGGGYDLYGRMLAAHLGPKLGANMIVLNRPGAGGTLATNQTWTAAPDGLMLQLTNTSGMISSELGGAPGVAYESAGFSWIGRVTSEAEVLSVGYDNAIDSIEALRAVSAERTLRFGSTGIGADNYIAAQILTLALDMESDIVVGFSGAPEVFASMARGEVDFFTSTYGSASRAQDAESVRILWLLEPEANPEYPNIPAVGEYLEGDGLELIRAQASVAFGGRGLVAPPGLAEDRLECLRDVFDTTVADPEFLADTVEKNLPVGPYSGEGIAEVITSLMSDPPEAYLALLRESFAN